MLSPTNIALNALLSCSCEQTNGQSVPGMRSADRHAWLIVLKVPGGYKLDPGS